MLFWTRACLCIGTVTVMAVGHLPAAPERPAAPAFAVPAATLVGEACRARPDLCAAAVTRGLGALSRPSEPLVARHKPVRHSARRETPVALGPRSLT